MPGADDLMMRVYAAMAQKERELISECTRAAPATGESLQDAAALVAAATGLPRKQVYARALGLREGKA
jgi:16S rRNA (cytidine1402-2'-O)-methyltransferase